MIRQVSLKMASMLPEESSSSTVNYPRDLVHRVSSIQLILAECKEGDQTSVGSFVMPLMAAGGDDTTLQSLVLERQALEKWRHQNDSSPSHQIHARGRQDNKTVTDRTLCEVGSALWNFASQKKSSIRPVVLLEAKALAAELLLNVLPRR